MPLVPYLLSLCLHVGIVLLIWFWPGGEPLINLEQPVLISLVEGAPGGNRTPSPILGPMGAPNAGEQAPSAPAQQAEVAQQEREEARPIARPEEAAPVPAEAAPEPVLKPVPKPEPKEEPVAVKKEEKKEPPKKEEKKPEKKEEKKPEKKPEKKDEKKKAEKKDTKKPATAKDKKKDDTDPVKAALAQARRKATSRASSSDRGSSVEQALAEARRNAGGHGGGGGGDGSGPGGGGLHSVYLGQVMLAVRPNWGYASATRKNLQCTIHIAVSRQGEVLSTQIVQSSGNAQYDASCVNAIMRTSKAGDFPPPPTSEYEKLDIVFTLNELQGR